jgi:hypothetical protein
VEYARSNVTTLQAQLSRGAVVHIADSEASGADGTLRATAAISPEAGVGAGAGAGAGGTIGFVSALQHANDVRAGESWSVLRVALLCVRVSCRLLSASIVTLVADSARDVGGAPVRPTHQWQWLGDGGVWIPYDYDQNHEIEAAFSAGRDKVRVIGDRSGEFTRSKYGFEYEIIFNKVPGGLHQQVHTSTDACSRGTSSSG